MPDGISPFREVMDTEHLDAGLVAAYLDRAVDETQREQIETHLAHCARCREELANLDETLWTLPSGKAWHWLGPMVAAAAVLTGLLVLQPWSEAPVAPGEPEQVIERAAPDVPTTAIQTLAPTANATVEPGGIELRWGSLGPGARYQVTLTTAAGDSVWGHLTSDTTAMVPPETRLDSGQEYLWYVDGLLPDGRTASTGIARFRTAP